MQIEGFTFFQQKRGRASLPTLKTVEITCRSNASAGPRTPCRDWLRHSTLRKICGFFLFQVCIMAFLFIKCSYFKIFCKIALLVSLQLTPSFSTLVEFGKQVIPHALCNVLVVSEGGFLFGVAQSLFGNDGGNIMLCKPTGVSMS